jgi:hypothetical protein
MAFSFTISKALPHTSIDDVIENVQELDLGTFTVDEKTYERDGDEFKKFWIHCDSWPTNDPVARDLRFRLEQNSLKQQRGERVESSDIPRIVYGTNRRTGKDMYWQIFICPTPGERQATYDNKAVKPKAKIVM